MIPGIHISTRMKCALPDTPAARDLFNAREAVFDRCSEYASNGVSPHNFQPEIKHLAVLTRRLWRMAFAKGYVPSAEADGSVAVNDYKDWLYAQKLN